MDVESGQPYAEQIIDPQNLQGENFIRDNIFEEGSDAPTAYWKRKKGKKKIGGSFRISGIDEKTNQKIGNKRIAAAPYKRVHKKSL